MTQIINISTSMFLLLIMLFMTMTSIEMKSINEDSSSDDSDGSMSDEEMNRQIRRSEISRALGLLKKHSVVGKDAKIVLKSNGKPHLLVDPTESLLLVSSHSHQQNNMINTKANKLQLKKQTSASNGTNKKKDSLRNKSASIGVQTKRQNNGKGNSKLRKRNNVRSTRSRNN